MNGVRSDAARAGAAPADAVVSLAEWRARRAPVPDGAPTLRVLPGGAAAPGLPQDGLEGSPATPGLRLDRFLARAAHVLAEVEGDGATVVPLERRRRGRRGGGRALAGGWDAGGPLATA